MAGIVIGDKIKNTDRGAINLDADYGPFASVEAATTALTTAKKLKTGRTVGITQQDGSIKEYWVQPKGTTPETYGLVEKGGEDLTKALTLSGEQKYNASANINDRAADVATTNEVKALGYKVLNPALSFAEQVENVVEDEIVIVDNSNTIFEIRDEFGLESGSVTIPANCTLKFNGGRVVNGTIVGQGTILEGNVKFESVSGSFASEIYSSYSSLECDYNKLAMLLTLSVDKLVIDENFQLTLFNNYISSTIKTINGVGSTIAINVDTPTDPFRFESQKLENITFDFTNKNVVGSSIYCTADVLFDISNVVVKNIRRTNNTTQKGTNGIRIGAEIGTKVNVSNVSLINISSIGNDTIGDACGSVQGLYIVPKNNCIVNVTDVVIDTIFNFDSNDDILFEDAGGIYYSCNDITTNNSIVNISNVKANNFGKRLIKSDGNNITIRDIVATSTNEDVLVVIGCNDSSGSTNFKPSNLIIDNVKFTGVTTQYFIAADMNNVNINNVEYKATTPTSATNVKTLISCYSSLTITNSYFRTGSINTVLFNRGGTDDITATFDNCTIDGDILYDSLVKNVICTNCNFNVNTKLELNYSSYDRRECKSIFDNCNFTSNAKSLGSLINSSGTYAIGSLYITNCKFTYTSKLLVQCKVVKDFIFEQNNVDLKDTTQNGSVVIAQVTKVTTTTPIALNCSIKNNAITTFKATAYDFQIINNETNPVYIGSQDGLKLSLTNCYSNSKSKFVSGSAPMAENGSRGVVAITNVGDVDIEYNDGWNFSKPSTYSLDNAVRIANAKTLKVGASVFCSTINKPIYWNGSAWIDGNGETVGLQVNDTSVLIAAAQNSSKTINVYSASVITAVSQVIDETSTTYTTGSTADTIESTSYYAGSAISLNEGDIIRIDGTAVILNSSKDAIVAFTSGKSYIASGTETIYLATTTTDTTVVYVKGNWLEASVGTASGSTYPVTLKALSANSTAPRGAKVIITNTGDEVVIVNIIQSY